MQQIETTVQEEQRDRRPPRLDKSGSILQAVLNKLYCGEGFYISASQFEQMMNELRGLGLRKRDIDSMIQVATREHT